MIKKLCSLLLLFAHCRAMEVEIIDRDQQLIQATSKNNEDEVRRLLKKQINLYARDKGGYTALDRAAYKGHIIIARLLLEKDKEQCLHEQKTSSSDFFKRITRSLFGLKTLVNSRNPDGYTPIHHASCQGHTELVELLINNGANRNLVERWTPLGWAVKNDHYETADLLLKKGAQLKFGVFYRNPADIIYWTDFGTEFLIRRGINLNQTNGLLKNESIGTRALRFAVKSNNKTVISVLLNHGARDSHGADELEALHVSAERNHLDITLLLLKGRMYNLVKTHSKPSFDTFFYVLCYFNRMKLALPKDIVKKILGYSEDLCTLAILGAAHTSTLKTFIPDIFRRTHRLINKETTMELLCKIAPWAKNTRIIELPLKNGGSFPASLPRILLNIETFLPNLIANWLNKDVQQD